MTCNSSQLPSIIERMRNRSVSSTAPQPQIFQIWNDSIACWLPAPLTMVMKMMMMWCVQSHRRTLYVSCVHSWLLCPGRLWPHRGKTSQTWATTRSCCGPPNQRCRIFPQEEWASQRAWPFKKCPGCEWPTAPMLPVHLLLFFLTARRLIPGWSC